MKNRSSGSAYLNRRAAEGVEQDQTARMCRLILLTTLRINQSIIATCNGRIMLQNECSIQARVVVSGASTTLEQEVADFDPWLGLFLSKDW